MEGAERDSTRDWLLPDASTPPLIGELERRIDEAVATANASEAAVMTVGAAALDAAEQARRAAELAERASAAMLGGSRGVQPSEARTELSSAPAPPDDSLRSFTERADRVARRLHELERV
jgi:hypothetical protein